MGNILDTDTANDMLRDTANDLLRDTIQNEDQRDTEKDGFKALISRDMRDTAKEVIGGKQ